MSLKFHCCKCPKKFKTKGGLNIHLRSHNPKEFLLQCPECEFITIQKANLAKHMATRHCKGLDGEMLSLRYPCSICEIFLGVTEAQLKAHILRKHSTISERKFKCPDCLYSTVDKSDFHKHIRSRHTKQKPYVCEICDFRSITSSILARHRRSHNNEKPYECSICQCPFADKKRLREHEMRHRNEKPFICHYCNKYSTNRKDNLKTHIKRSHIPSKMDIQLTSYISSKFSGSEQNNSSDSPSHS